MQARGLLLLVVVVLAGAAWFAVDRSRIANTESLMPTRTADPPGVERTELEVATHQFLEPQEPQRAAAAPPRIAAQPVVAAPNAPTKKATHRLSGTVVATDSEGKALEPIDGTFSLGVKEERSLALRQVLVERGEWTVEIESDLPPELEVRRLVTPDATFIIVQPVEELRFAFPEDGRLEIRARRSPRSVLHVIDERDGSPLTGVEIVAASGEGMKHPEPRDARFAQDLASPVDLLEILSLSERQFGLPLFVGARGFQWERITVDFLSGGERTVALGPGGDLHVTLVGFEAMSNTKLKLQPAGFHSFLTVDPFSGAKLEGRAFLSAGNFRLLAVAPTKPAERLFRGLPPGPLRVAVDLGEFWPGPFEVGQSEVTIVAGERVHTTITAKAQPRLETAPVRGILLVPTAWQAEVPKIATQLLERPLGGFNPQQTASVTRSDQRRDGHDVFEWRFSGLQVGQHQWKVSQPPLTMPIVVPEDGLTDVEVLMPAPGELLVRVVDSRTGHEVVPQSLTGSWTGSDGQTRGLAEVERDPESNAYRIRAPAVWIELDIWSWKYERKKESVDLSSGSGTYTVYVDPTNALEIVLKDGNTTVPFSDSLYSFLKPADAGNGQCLQVEFLQFRQRFHLSRPGLWEFQPPTIPGYRTPELDTIDVRAGEVTVHEIQLVRE